jgi:endoglucanase
VFLHNIMHRLTIALFLAASICAVAQQKPAPSAQPLAEVPQARFAHLRHGINLSHWFAQSPTGQYDQQRLTTYMTASDFDLIKSMGFDHVRFTLDPTPLFFPWQPDKLNTDYLRLVDDAVQMPLSRGLAVIIDIHPSSDFKQKLARGEHDMEGFTDFWHALAAHFAATDPEHLFFEVMNEPEMTDGWRWYGVQTQLVASIRSAAPQHTIVVTGHGWSAVNSLVALEPLADRNVVYNFHYYDPHTFTHQSATWGAELWHHLPRVHYPSQPGADAELIQSLPQFTQKLDLVRYDQDRWGRERIEAEIAQVATWAALHHVRVTCNEFGVYQKADPEERAAWLRDVRTSLEQHGIGWTMWDYAGGFDVVSGDPGHRVPDDRVLKALGLK